MKSKPTVCDYLKLILPIYLFNFVFLTPILYGVARNEGFAHRPDPGFHKAMFAAILAQIPGVVAAVLHIIMTKSDRGSGLFAFVPLAASSLPLASMTLRDILVFEVRLCLFLVILVAIIDLLKIWWKTRKAIKSALAPDTQLEDKL